MIVQMMLYSSDKDNSMMKFITIFFQRFCEIERE